MFKVCCIAYLSLEHFRLFSPKYIECLGEGDNLSVQLDEVDSDYFEFVESGHRFFLGEVQTEKMDEVAVLDTNCSVVSLERWELVDEDSGIVIDVVDLEGLAE